jgi:hypothetical protein
MVKRQKRSGGCRDGGKKGFFVIEISFGWLVDATVKYTRAIIR